MHCSFFLSGYLLQTQARCDRGVPNWAEWSNLWIHPYRCRWLPVTRKFHGVQVLNSSFNMRFARAQSRASDNSVVSHD